jgi:hypothetical protein
LQDTLKHIGSRLRASSKAPAVAGHSLGLSLGAKAFGGAAPAPCAGEADGPAAEGAYAIRVSVCAVSEYKVCSANPQGSDDDTWLRVSGKFRQTFFLLSQDSLSAALGGAAKKLVMSDKLVSIEMAQNRPDAL